MFMIPFLRSSDPFMLVVGMTGVKLGDRMVQVGCAHGGRLGAVAVKVGISGRAVAVVPDEVSAARVRKGASEAGALVELEIAPPTGLPLEAASFDLAIVDDTQRLLAGMPQEDRGATVRELLRVLRPGGRAMVIGAGPRTGLGALFSRAPQGPQLDPVPLLEAGGFSKVRTLAAREGLVFVEGVKTRT
jgi:ubiquinone/menaquinone biosynthesis C-methylase UbiE